MIIKVSEATNIQIDWLVAKCKGVYLAYPVPLDTGCTPFLPTTNWAQGGPIIEREKIHTKYWKSEDIWEAGLMGGFFESYGPTPLIAAMRCFVMSKLGDEVEVPDGLK